MEKRRTADGGRQYARRPTHSPLSTPHFVPPLTIGVVADTHVYPHGARRLPAEVPALFARFGVGLILHAGDVNTGSVLDELAVVAPILAVSGNNDDADLSARLPTDRRFTVGRFAFVLIHGHGGASALAVARRVAQGGQPDCVVYGHSHIPRIDQEGETILFNPGSATDRRWSAHFGVGLIHVTEDAIRPELVLYGDARHLGNVGR